jgi:ribonuclease VapC
MTVLDSSAALAVLFQEPGADIVAGHLPDARISAVNLSEVVGVYQRSGAERTATELAIDALALAVVPHDTALARETGFLEAASRPTGLSLGDRACLALAMSQGRLILTSDRALVSFASAIGVRAELFR